MTREKWENLKIVTCKLQGACSAGTARKNTEQQEKES